MEVMGVIVLAGGFLYCVVYWARMLNRVARVQREAPNVKFTPVEANDNKIATAKFKELLHEAQSSLIVYDDGDDVDDSIYKNEEIASLTRQKLQDNPNFHIRCLFNADNPELAFRKALDGCSRADIRILNSHSFELPIHYKIIDNGTKAYLSRHPRSSSERHFSILDCTEVSEADRKLVVNVVLGEYRGHFDWAFKVAKSSG